MTQTGGAGTETLTARYRYTSSGQRYRTAYTGSEAEHYALDGSETVGVFSESGELQYWNASGAGRHLADGSRRYYLTDHLGSVRTVVDGTGTLVEAKDDDPYGLELPGRTVQASPSTKEGFTGHETDGATGLVYAGARYYMPAVPRWTSTDPLADLYPGHSPYNYAMGDPISLVDPTGRCPEGVNHGDVFTDDSGTEVMCYNEGNPEGAVAEAERPTEEPGESSSSTAGVAVVAGGVAMIDSPAPGPADVVAVGILMGPLIVEIYSDAPPISTDNLLPGAYSPGAFPGDALPSFVLPSASYPSAEELARRLGTDVGTFHRDIKPAIIKDHRKEAQKIGARNPDIGITDSGNISLRNPKNGREIETDTPAEAYNPNF